MFGRKTRCGVFAIFIDTEEVSRLARAPQIPAARRLERSLDGKALAISVVRLDYSKGIAQCFEAFARFLELHPAYRHRLTAVQIAAPTREQVLGYAELDRHVAEVAGRINGAFGDSDHAQADWPASSSSDSIGWRPRVDHGHKRAAAKRRRQKD
jgi:trehalose 6-phosphate synthase